MIWFSSELVTHLVSDGTLSFISNTRTQDEDKTMSSQPAGGSKKPKPPTNQAKPPQTSTLPPLPLPPPAAATILSFYHPPLCHAPIYPHSFLSILPSLFLLSSTQAKLKSLTEDMFSCTIALL